MKERTLENVVNLALELEPRHVASCGKLGRHGEGAGNTGTIRRNNTAIKTDFRRLLRG